MSKLGEQFSELRKSTPKYVQWLLLIAAFIVVLILLTLLMTGSKNKTVKPKVNSVPVKIELSNNTVDWSNVDVGSKKTETIFVKTNAPARATVRRNKEIEGFNVKTTCTDASEITVAIPCRIILEYSPIVAMNPQTVTLFVDWRAASEPEDMNTSDQITITLGAVAPEIRSVPKPIVQTEPEPEYDYDGYDDDYGYDDEPEPTIRSEIESIAPSLSFNDNPVVEKPTQPVQRPSESCSDFAFPGYDSSGNQIGWIKPDRGAYYFHPFSDRDCEKATGIYNPASGLITDIDGRGNRIGTDAEHIGYAVANAGTLPALTPSPRNAAHTNVTTTASTDVPIGGMGRVIVRKAPDVTFGTTDTNAIISTQPYDRTFILRQYKPIPATIVSDVRADSVLDRDNNLQFPVRATVDRNVYSDDGRTVVIPTGTLLLGYVTGEVPGPYKAIGRMNIVWYQFVLPNGVEFNFASSQEPISGDSQGRIGVPGRGSTDYIEQFVMPMLTAIVPAAVNMIAPVADKFVNQIDLDNNTVVQSGTMRSSELAKNEIITAWNQVAQKLLVDMMDNTVPPFTIPAGTRITVYSKYDLMVACTDATKKCYMNNAAEKANIVRREPNWGAAIANYNDGSWVGQARSFALGDLCTTRGKDGVIEAPAYAVVKEDLQKLGYSYSTLVAFCQSSNYQAINNARQAAIYQNQQSTDNKNSVASNNANPSQGVYTKEYNENVLGLKYNEDGSIKDPYKKESTAPAAAPAANVITCEDGLAPDANGCCPGEIYTDMGEQGFNCCPQTGGDCFPPIL